MSIPSFNYNGYQAYPNPNSYAYQPHNSDYSQLFAPSAPPMEDVENDPYAASAPPMEEMVDDQSQLPDLDDECPICTQTYKEVPEDDSRQYSVLGKTDCNHFFHEFCIKKYLTPGVGVNQNCPMCRHHLSSSDIKPIHLHGSQQNADLQNAPDELAAAEKKEEGTSFIGEMAGLVSLVGYNIVKGSLSLAYAGIKHGGSALISAVAHNLGFSDAAREETIGRRTSDIFSKWNRMEKEFGRSVKDNKEEINVLLAKVRSLPVSEYGKAKNILDSIEKNTKLYEGKMKELQMGFSKFLENETKKLA